MDTHQLAISSTLQQCHVCFHRLLDDMDFPIPPYKHPMSASYPTVIHAHYTSETWVTQLPPTGQPCHPWLPDSPRRSIFNDANPYATSSTYYGHPSPPYRQCGSLIPCEWDLVITHKTGFTFLKVICQRNGFFSFPVFSKIQFRLILPVKIFAITLLAAWCTGQGKAHLPRAHATDTTPKPWHTSCNVQTLPHNTSFDQNISKLRNLSKDLNTDPNVIKDLSIGVHAWQLNHPAPQC